MAVSNRVETNPDPPTDAWSSPGIEGEPIVGGMVGLFLGGLVGGLMGSLVKTDRWQDVDADLLTIGVTSRPSGQPALAFMMQS